jgi:deoxyribonuclease V
VTPWTSDTTEAKQEQRVLQKRLRHEKLDWQNARSALAIGVAYNERNKTAVCVGIPSLPTGQEIDSRSYAVEVIVDFPYKAGLYAYREGPAVSMLLESLSYRPEFLIFDAQGIAHPRGMGLAAHLSLLHDIPAFGLTRKRLFGRYEEPSEHDGSSSPLSKDDGSIIGYAYRMTARCDVVFASPGHRADLVSLLAWLDGLSAVRACFPSALQRAHKEANSLARNVRLK